MHGTIDRQKLERFGRMLAEVKRRRAKKEQSQRGWYDDNGVRQGGLIAFIRYFWKLLEPENELIEGWPLYAVTEHLEAITSGQINRLLITVPPGFMKEVNVDEPVLTLRGRIKLGDVVIGDSILTHKGRFRSVKKIADKGHQPTLLVTTANGRKVRAEISHPFFTTRGWIEARFLRAGDILAAVMPAVDPFEDNQSGVGEEEARLLGYLVGDGALSHSPSFINADEEILCDFINCAHALGFKATRAELPPSLKPKSKAIKVGLRGTLPWLERHQLKNKTSYTKRVPKAIFRSSETIIANFVGAYWSCDGMIKVRHKRARGDLHMATCTTVSEGLARDLQHLLLRLGINARVRRKTRAHETKRQPGGVYVSWDVFSATHDNAVKFFQMPGLCSRKSDLLRLLTPQKFYQGPLFEDEVISVEEIGTTECRCLEVEEDHSFTASDIAVHNSLCTDVFWPAWEWGPMKKAHLRYVAFSYSASLTERDNDKFRLLVASPEYQALYGPIKIAGEGVELRNKTTTKVINTKQGWKLASSVGGVGTGERGNRVILDDAHNIKEAESETIRTETVRWFRESMSDRLNSVENDAIVVIMQRSHEEDVAGAILSLGLPYTHLMVPMEYDPSRQTDENGEPRQTEIGWYDPREQDGELAWPERFSAEVVRDLCHVKGPFAYAGQYQQSPTPRGGGIFKRDWWQVWEPVDGKFPLFDLIVASLDGAFTEKEENDPSALTVWGIFTTKENKRAIMLVHAWRKHLQFSAPPIELKPRETRAAYKQRTSQTWGLMEWVHDTCIRFKADRLLIEAKASGISAAQELQNRWGIQDFAVQLCPVKGDKVARAYGVQPTFSQHLVYAPDRDWAEQVIEEMEVFPKGKYDDLTDSATQALKYLRDIGLARTDEEERFADYHRGLLKPKLRPLYPV